MIKDDFNDCWTPSYLHDETNDDPFTSKSIREILINFISSTCSIVQTRRISRILTTQIIQRNQNTLNIREIRQ